jgi:hypothetical protein
LARDRRQQPIGPIATLVAGKHEAERSVQETQH